jgi:hypothetical protein
VAETGQPYAGFGDDPINGTDPLGMLYSNGTGTGGETCSQYGCGQQAVTNEATYATKHPDGVGTGTHTVPVSDSSKPVPILQTPTVSVQASFNGTITGPNPLNLQVSPDGTYSSVDFDIPGSVGATAGFSFTGDVTGALNDGTFSLGLNGFSDTIPGKPLSIGSDTLTYSVTVTVYPTITPTEVYASAGVVGISAITFTYFSLRGAACAGTVVDPELALGCAGG